MSMVGYGLWALIQYLTLATAGLLFDYIYNDVVLVNM